MDDLLPDIDELRHDAITEAVGYRGADKMITELGTFDFLEGMRIRARGLIELAIEVFFEDD